MLHQLHRLPLDVATRKQRIMFATGLVHCLYLTVPNKIHTTKCQSKHSVNLTEVVNGSWISTIHTRLHFISNCKLLFCCYPSCAGAFMRPAPPNCIFPLRQDHKNYSFSDRLFHSKSLSMLSITNKQHTTTRKMKCSMCTKEQSLFYT